MKNSVSSVELFAIPGISIHDNLPAVFRGTLTHLFSKIAVVNNALVFPLKKLKNPVGQTVLTGSKVLVRVCWPHGRPCKVVHAELDEVLSDKASVGDVARHFSGLRIGRVTFYCDEANQGSVDEALDFQLSHCADGYVPSKNDWVQVKLDDKNGAVICVCPNRIGQLIGRVQWFRDRQNPDDRVFGSLASCAIFECSLNPEFAGLPEGCLVFANVVERSPITGGNRRTQGPDSYKLRWKSRYSWRVVQAVPVEEATYDEVSFSLSGRFYWTARISDNSPDHQFVICTKHGFSPEQVAVTLHPDSMFYLCQQTISGNSLKFTIGCDETSKKSKSHVELIVTVCPSGLPPKLYRYWLLYHSDFSFECPVQGKASLDGASLNRWRDYDPNSISCRGKKYMQAEGRPTPPLYVRGSVPYEPKQRVKDLFAQCSKDAGVWSRICEEYPEMTRPLSADNYAEKFHFLLHIEQLAREVQAFALPEQPVIFQKEDDLLTFKWPFPEDQLAAVAVNDKILADGCHEGFVHKVDGDKISVQFNAAFYSSYKTDRQLCRIRCIPNTSTFRRCHEAVHQAKTNGDLCSLMVGRVGREETACSGSNMPNIVWFNDRLNAEQKTAVAHMLKRPRGPCLHPFILFGPPGTGKTVTFVEAIEQTFQQSSYNKILICAPSNAATDVICSKLIATGRYSPADLGRLYAYSREWQQVPDSIKPFALMLSGGTPQSNSRVSDEDLARRLLCTTFVCAAQLRLSSGRHVHFSHVFLDECSQASEPETLIPVLLAHGHRDGKAIVALAGDPFQLGPVIMSSEAERLGLGVSMLERLYLCEQCRDRPDKRVVRLCRTYRFKHVPLIKVPSRLFYEDRLIVDTVETETDLPLQFVDVDDGKCEREPNSTSFYNTTEALLVCREVVRVLKSTNYTDIGVITPYRAQVRKIRALVTEVLNASAAGDSDLTRFRVGSVEEFQGAESDVIIVSTVRDSSYNSIGFLTNPKRFNVAVTRARHRLVIFGNKEALLSNVQWSHLITYAQEIYLKQRKG